MATAQRAQWRQCVRDWRESRLTAREFAEQLGVKEGTLRHWAWELGNEARQGPAELGRPGFVEVTLRPGTADAAAIEIEIRDGVRVRVSKDFDEQTLRRVIQVLEVR